MDKFQAKLAEIYKKNIYKDAENIDKTPDFIKKSSFLCFVLNGFFRLLFVLIVCIVLLSIAVWVWSDTLMKARWTEPFFESDILQTDCVCIAPNVKSYVESEYSVGNTPDHEARKGIETDYIGWLYEQKPVEKVYGFADSHVKFEDKYSDITLQIGTPETFDLLKFEIIGSPLNNNPDKTDDLPEVLLSGASFANYKPGDIITISDNDIYDYSESNVYRDLLPKQKAAPMNCRVVGKITFPYQTIDDYFLVTSKSPFYSTNTENKILMLYNEHNMSLLKNKGYTVRAENNNYYVKYKSDAKQADIDAVRNILNGKYVYNTYYYTSSPNVVWTAGEMEIMPEKPVPLVFRAIFAPVPLMLAAICSFLLCIVMISIIKTILQNKLTVPKKIITVGDIVKTSVVITVLSFVIPYVTTLFRCFAVLNFCSSDEVIPMAYLELLLSPHMIKLTIAIIVMMLIIIVPAVIFSIRKMNETIVSKQKTKESLTYRPPEYYTPDSYSPNDFEKADYDLINKCEPEDIKDAVEGKDTPEQ